jgi:ferritin-like metal-binding protein YciE
MTRIRFDGCDLSRARHPGAPSVRIARGGTVRLVAELFTSARGLLASRLRQMLWIELQLSEKVLPELREQAHASDLRWAFERHLLETEKHAETLRDVLHELQVPADPAESPAFEGLVDEHEQLVEQIPEEHELLRDLACAQSAAATEHLEMAAYRSLASLAETLGEETVAIRLREVMEQEELALEQVERATAKLLAEKVESERL